MREDRVMRGPPVLRYEGTNRTLIFINVFTHIEAKVCVRVKTDQENPKSCTAEGLRCVEISA